MWKRREAFRNLQSHVPSISVDSNTSLKEDDIQERPLSVLTVASAYSHEFGLGKRFVWTMGTKFAINIPYEQQKISC